LNTTNAQFGGRFFGEVGNGTYPYTAPTSSLITFGGVNTGQYQEVNYNGDDYIMYCFHSVDGYSKVGSYTGNGSADGPFIYLGFRPAFFLMKSSSHVSGWVMWDATRFPENKSQTERIFANDNAVATNRTIDIDLVSNGVKIRDSDDNPPNLSGYTYSYMAFAESPFKYSNAR